MLQGTKYTALCSFSIGFYSIEIEQTAYRNILSLQPRTHPQLLLASVTYFMIKKIGTDEMRAETILNLGRLSRATKPRKRKTLQLQFFFILLPRFSF